MSLSKNMHVRLPEGFSATHGVTRFQGGSKESWACWIPGASHTQGLDNGYLAYIPTELLVAMDLPTHTDGKGANGDGRCEHCPAPDASVAEVERLTAELAEARQALDFQRDRAERVQGEMRANWTAEAQRYEAELATVRHGYELNQTNLLAELAEANDHAEAAHNLHANAEHMLAEAKRERGTAREVAQSNKRHVEAVTQYNELVGDIVEAAKASWRAEGSEEHERQSAHHQLMAAVAQLYGYEIGATDHEPSSQRTPTNSQSWELERETIASVLTHTIGYGGETLGEGVRRLGILLERERRIVEAAKAVVRAKDNLGRADGAMWRLRTAIDDLDLADIEARVAADKAVIQAAKAWRAFIPTAADGTTMFIPENALIFAVDALAALEPTPAAATPAVETPAETETPPVVYEWGAQVVERHPVRREELGDVIPVNELTARAASCIWPGWKTVKRAIGPWVEATEGCAGCATCKDAARVAAGNEAP